MLNYINKLYGIIPDLIAGAPIIYSELLSRHSLSKSKYICLYKNNYNIFACIVYYINKKMSLFMNTGYFINYEIADYIIADTEQGKGYGFHMMKIILTLFPTGNIYLWTTKNNIRAISLYKKCGFKEINVPEHMQQFYYTKNPWLHDAIIGFIIVR